MPLHEQCGLGMGKDSKLAGLGGRSAGGFIDGCYLERENSRAEITGVQRERKSEKGGAAGGRDRAQISSQAGGVPETVDCGNLADGGRGAHRRKVVKVGVNRIVRTLNDSRRVNLGSKGQRRDWVG